MCCICHSVLPHCILSKVSSLFVFFHDVFFARAKRYVLVFVAHRAFRFRNVSVSYEQSELNSVHEALLGAVEEQDGEEHDDDEGNGAVEHTPDVEGADTEA